MIVEQFVGDHDLSFSRKRFNAQIAEGTVGEHRVMIAKPQDVYELSGESVANCLRSTKSRPPRSARCLRRSRFAARQNAPATERKCGGHHGMESIHLAIGTSDFPRLRVGIVARILMRMSIMFSATLKATNAN